MVDTTQGEKIFLNGVFMQSGRQIFDFLLFYNLSFLLKKNVDY